MDTVEYMLMLLVMIIMLMMFLMFWSIDSFVPARCTEYRFIVQWIQNCYFLMDWCEQDKTTIWKKMKIREKREQEHFTIKDEFGISYFNLFNADHSCSSSGSTSTQLYKTFINIKINLKIKYFWSLLVWCLALMFVVVVFSQFTIKEEKC